MVDFDAATRKVEKALLVWALKKEDGVLARAAESLNMPYRSFRHYISKHGISRGLWLKTSNSILSERARARRIAREAVYSGKIERPDVCSRCENPGRIEGHHLDYSKPLEIVWLCVPCHRREHALPN